MRESFSARWKTIPCLPMNAMQRDLGSGCRTRSCRPGKIDLCGRTYQPTRVLAISHLLGRFVANGFKVAVRRDDWMKRRGSASVQVFGRRRRRGRPQARRPASEKRRGTKSREVGHRRCRGLYGDLAAASGWARLVRAPARLLCLAGWVWMTGRTSAAGVAGQGWRCHCGRIYRPAVSGGYAGRASQNGARH